MQTPGRRRLLLWADLLLLLACWCCGAPEELRPEGGVSCSASGGMNAIKSVRRMAGGPMDTPNPFLFCVYHKDRYPAGNDKMEHPTKRGDGMDFDQSAPFRMYHGDRVPGFPVHPHRGFETLTATIDGVIDHADSLHNAGRYGMGDLQWMTAGRGVCHGEMFPLIHMDRENPTRFFQIWLNLERRSKMADPAFVMHWAHEIRKWRSADGGAQATVWAGAFKDAEASGKPPPDSYAASPDAHIGVFHLTLQPGASVTLDACAGGDEDNRSLYFVEGREATLGGQKVRREGAFATLIETRGGAEVEVSCDAAQDAPCEFLVLQGRPIDEPVVQHGPFVMNSREEIAQTFEDYQRTRFGGWPWPRDDMVFPRTKGRFALLGGVETAPPDAQIL